MNLPEDRYFDPNPSHKAVALALYNRVRSMPLICPHGHVDPRLFTDPDYGFGTPVDLLILPDHYVFRMLYSQGIALESLGLARRDGRETEHDHRKIWQVFAENFHLFNGTPTGVWLRDELFSVFGVQDKLNADNAQAVYDQIAEKLESPECSPRSLFERFNIEVLCTTDAATDRLDYHRMIRESGWSGQVLPTFRPDAVVNIDTENWRGHIDLLSEVAGIDVTGYKSFVAALENRREYFQSMGARATDHAALTPEIAALSEQEAEAIFQRALQGEADEADARRFTGHMLMEMARMSVEDGLVMQLHIGAYRNHNRVIFEHFGRDMGADIPIQAEFTRSMLPFFDRFGSNPHLTVILFTLDETTYSRELAPLAGHYPAIKLGPPWWFFDSLNGMRRYFDGVMETAGIYNTAGFNDDTRAFPSIPARHDLWRRASANWLAGLVVRSIIDRDAAVIMIEELAYGLAKRAYQLEEK